jgi:YHS domain-containing protein
MNTNSILSLLWWVGIALFFFWMMRRGGCGGMAHGHGGHGGSPGGSASDKPVDPVCKMGVDPARAVGTRLASGRTFFFCSQTCLDTFDKNPSVYTQDMHAESSHHGQHAGC